MIQTFPDWVLEQKKKGIAIEKRGGKLLRLTGNLRVGSGEKKSAEENLRVFVKGYPQGIIPPKGKRLPRLGGVLDAGNFAYLKHFTGHIAGSLRVCFLDDWQSILAAAAICLCYHESFGRMVFGMKQVLRNDCGQGLR